jgi:hypothetical protein
MTEENLTPWQRWKKNLGQTRPWDLLDSNAPRTTDEEAFKRLDICKSCPELLPITHQCKKCGCIMSLKVKLAEASCPLDKWGVAENVIPSATPASSKNPIDDMVFRATVTDNFVSKEDCEYLVNLVKDSDLWGGGGSEFWANRVINYTSLLSVDKKAASIVLDANRRCGELIKETYKTDSVYSDTLQVIRWYPGMEQPPHADDMVTAGIDGFAHRVYGSIIYLNDEYQGGKTYYPNFNFEISPKVGSLAVHPGDDRHLHGVTKIEGGMRYTIASFWTFNKELANDWSLYQ